MPRILKVLLIVLAVVVVLVLGVAAAVLLLVDPNDYREEIAALVEDQTGREFVIEGDLGLDVLPCCAVSIADTRLGNPPGFDTPTFASIGRLSLGVRLIPLLFDRRIVVDEITLDDLQVDLVKRADGTANWEFETEAGEAPPPPGEPEESAALPALSVAGVRISGANVSYIDETDDTRVAVEQLDVSSGPVEAGAPVELEASFRLRDFASQTVADTTLSTTMTMTEDAAGATLSALDLRADVTSPELPDDGASLTLNVASAGLDFDSGAATLEGLRSVLRAAGVEVDIQASGTAGDDMALQGSLSVPPFSPREVLAATGAAPVETADPDVLDAMQLDATFAVRGDRLRIDDLQMQFDASTVTGSLATNYADQSATTFAVALDAIDLDRYMAPPVEPPAAGTPAAAGTGGTELPVDTLRDLDIDGKVTIGQLTVGGMRLDNASARIRGADGILTIDPSQADVYGGRYTGTVRLDARGEVPVATFTQSLSGVRARELLADRYDARNLRGSLNANFEGTGSGKTTDALLENLKGAVSMDLDDAVYDGIDVWYEIRKTVARVKGKPLPEPPASPQTEITALGFTGRIGDGRVTSDKLEAEIPFIRIDGGGVFNLINDRLDFRLKARMLSRPNFPDADDLADLERVAIPIVITGTAAAPKIGIDLAELAKDAAVQKAQDRILKKLGLDQPEESADQPTDQPAGEGTGSEPQQEEPDAKDQARDVLKKGLRDLLGN